MCTCWQNFLSQILKLSILQFSFHHPRISSKLHQAYITNSKIRPWNSKCQSWIERERCEPFGVWYIWNKIHLKVNNWKSGDWLGLKHLSWILQCGGGEDSCIMHKAILISRPWSFINYNSERLLIMKVWWFISSFIKQNWNLSEEWDLLFLHRINLFNPTARYFNFMKWTGKIQENNKRFSSGSVSIYVVHQTSIVQQIDLSVT